MKIKENDKKNKYLDLARELKKHEGYGDINWNVWNVWNGLQRFY